MVENIKNEEVNPVVEETNETKKSGGGFKMFLLGAVAAFCVDVIGGKIIKKFKSEKDDDFDEWDDFEDVDDKDLVDVAESTEDDVVVVEDEGTDENE